MALALVLRYTKRLLSGLYMPEAITLSEKSAGYCVLGVEYWYIQMRGQGLKQSQA